MPAVHIREVPEEILEALKRRAERNHRSLQKELQHILASVVRDNPHLEELPPLKLHFSTTSSNKRWSREEIYSDDGR